MKAGAKWTSNRFRSQTKNMMKAHGEGVWVGHFESQGEHYSGMTYPELLAYWDRGGKTQNPAQIKRILPLVKVTVNLRSSEFNSIRDRWFRDGNLNKLLNDLGRTIAQHEKSLFGKNNPPYMMPDRANTPLLETGDLKDKTAYKTTTEGSVKEV